MSATSKKISPKIRRAFVEVMHNGKTKKEALALAGYSQSSIDQKKPLKSVGWKQLMNKYLPDTTLARVHMEGLVAVNEEDFPDHAIRHKYLDTAYKLKGMYPKEAGPMIAVQVNVDDDRREFGV